MKSFLSLLWMTLLIGAVGCVPTASAATIGVLSDGMSSQELKQRYQEAQQGGRKVRILIVPGHEPAFGGAEFLGYYERELVVTIAEQLQKELSTDPNLEILVSRGNAGWNENLSSYFENQERSIERFVSQYKSAMHKLIRRGKVEENTEQAVHNTAPDDVALRLYGITKWSNEHDVDLMVHLHLNDEMSHKEKERGEFGGMAVYVPDAIYGNAEASHAVAKPVFARLNATTATSTFGYEVKGVLEDRDLIALGANDTSDVPSILIEYSYLYESRLTGSGAQQAVLTDFAYHTALGIEDFFGASHVTGSLSRALPYTFSTDLLAPKAPSNPDALYALQVALLSLGFYPGTQTLAECPVSGFAGTCTKEALIAFQKAQGLEQTGTLGPRTRAALRTALGGTPPAAVSITMSACAPFTHTLVLNTTDAKTNGEVSRLQTILAKDPTIYPTGNVTGYYGPATDAALKALQVVKGIAKKGEEGYGLLGPRTKAVLLEACVP